MLTKDQRTLLDNVFESLNRLFDRVSTVADVHALLVATAIAMRGTQLADAFEDPIRQLNPIVRSNATPDRKRDLGLADNDGLRRFVAEQLR
jgi:hypothetical protein